MADDTNTPTPTARFVLPIAGQIEGYWIADGEIEGQFVTSGPCSTESGAIREFKAAASLAAAKRKLCEIIREVIANPFKQSPHNPSLPSIFPRWAGAKST